jgi:hypothetical protein
MKSILLYINRDVGQESRLRVALSLVHSRRGKLHCVQVTPTPGYYVADPTGLVVIPDIMGALEQQARAERKEIESRLSSENVDWEWIDAVGHAGPPVAPRSRGGVSGDRPRAA